VAAARRWYQRPSSSPSPTRRQQRPIEVRRHPGTCLNGSCQAERPRTFRMASSKNEMSANVLSAAGGSNPGTCPAHQFHPTKKPPTTWPKVRESCPRSQVSTQLLTMVATTPKTAYRPERASTIKPSPRPNGPCASLRCPKTIEQRSPLPGFRPRPPASRPRSHYGRPIVHNRGPRNRPPRTNVALVADRQHGPGAGQSRARIGRRPRDPSP